MFNKPATVRRNSRFSATGKTAEEAFFKLTDDIAKVEGMDGFFVVSSSHHILETNGEFFASALVVFTRVQEVHH